MGHGIVGLRGLGSGNQRAATRERGGEANGEKGVGEATLRNVGLLFPSGELKVPAINVLTVESHRE